MANFVIVKDPLDLRYVKGHIIFPHRSPFVKVIKHPDLSHVQNASPIFWKLWGNLIIEMAPAEKEAKLKLLKDPDKYKNNMSVLYPWYWTLFFVAMVLLAVYLAFHYKKFLGL